MPSQRFFTQTRWKQMVVVIITHSNILFPINSDETNYLGVAVYIDVTLSHPVRLLHAYLIKSTETLSTGPLFQFN